MIPRPPSYTLFPYTTLFRSLQFELNELNKLIKYLIITVLWFVCHLNFELSFNNLIFFLTLFAGSFGIGYVADKDRKSTRLNSSHVRSSYAVFCLKKKKMSLL